MSGRSDLSVGLTVLAAVALFIAAAVWLGELGGTGPRTLAVARFRTVGGVGVGDPVVMRGVKVGRVEAIRLAPDDWVEAELRISSPDDLPSRPIAIAASASLFGEWQIAVLDSALAPEDPEVRRLLIEASQGAGERWPGATLPDIGQLTAQASRIATDVATVTNRVEGLIDSNTVRDLRGSVADLRAMTAELLAFTERQSKAMDRVVDNAVAGSDDIASASEHLQATLGRIDSSTSKGQLSELVTNARDASVELRAASSDLRAVAGTANEQRERLANIVGTTEQILTRLEQGEGTLGMLSRDSTLYREATLTVVQLRTLLSDIQANPRRYFRFSVF
ncbi:MAG: MlaD family protein [Gemmatimonadales bacterium]|nr:MlaD family protein [Gemmatimonadales bacterium]MDZ4390771.1 MlaD family protein [Gemmatimonadales bacterium]